MLETIQKFIQEKKLQELREYVKDIKPVDLAASLDEMEGADLVVLIRLLPKDLAAEVFSFLETEAQQHIIEAIRDVEVKAILDELFLDDMVDFIEEMPAGIVRKVLRNTDSETRTLINQFLNYEESSAGSIMTIEYVSIKEQMTLAQAINYVRKIGVESETIDVLFIIDSARHLTGIVHLRDLILNDENKLVSDIMKKKVIKAKTGDDQEVVAQRFKKYDLLAMPVVDKEDRLVGIITIDDVVDIIDQENTEDFHKMAAMEPNEEPYLKTSVFTLAKKRITWLLVLMLSATITGNIIEGAEHVLASVAILASFIPMLMDTGGNSGSQSSAMVIRELALGGVSVKDYLKVFFKEIRTGLLTATGLIAVNFLRMVFFTQATTPVIITVSVTLGITVIVSNITGGLLPLLAKALRLDPAVMAGPLITTVVDTVALIFYFMTARAIMGI